MKDNILPVALVWFAGGLVVGVLVAVVLAFANFAEVLDLSWSLVAAPVLLSVATGAGAALFLLVLIAIDALRRRMQR